MSARLVALGALSLAFFACDMSVPVDPDGFLCDPGGVCPPGYVCAQNVCRSQATVCAELTCATPPVATCKDGSTLRTFAATGTCIAETGGCSYASADRTCEQGCVDGACVGEDPCANVTCDQPPAPSCADATTLTTYASAGTCSAGTCDYPSTAVTCANGCQNGACVDPCAAVICDQPPPAACEDATTLTTYASTGTCTGGTCGYTSTTVTCANGCQDGACVGDPCAGVTCDQPPAAACADSTKLTTYPSTGTCNAGTCQYAPSTQTCANGCQNGACLGDPCAGVTCNQPPAAVCADSTRLTTYASPGTCSAGTCQYAPSTQSCANGCQNGACLGDPCAGVTCNQPPAAVCADSTRLTTYASTGTCSAGTCQYSAATQSCAFACVAGACVSAPKTFAPISPRVPGWINGIDIGPSSSGNMVLAVGEAGLVARWDGTSWTKIPSGVTSHLKSVWLASDTVGYIVGNGGTLLKYQSGTITPLSSGTTTDFVSVHGAGALVVAVNAGGGRSLSTNGTTFAYSAGKSSMETARQVFVDPDDSTVRIAGLCSTTTSTTKENCIDSRTGSTWYLDRYVVASRPFTAVGPSTAAGLAYLGGAASVIRHQASSGDFDSLDVPTGVPASRLVGITSDRTPTPNIFLLAEDSAFSPGQLFRHSAAGGTTLVQQMWGERHMMSRNYSGGVAVVEATSSRSNIFRRGVTTNEALELGNIDYLAVDALAGRRVAINAYGDLVLAESGKSTLRLWGGDSTADFTGVVLAGSYALVFGKSGSYYRWTDAGGFGTRLTVTGAQDLRAGCRNSDSELYLVGAQGLIFRYDGALFTAMPSGTTATLNAVTCSGAGEAFAVGDGGTVLRLSQGSWSAVTPALGVSPVLTTVWAAGGELYVAGDGAFARYAGSRWTLLPALAALGELRGVSGTELYAASGNDVMRFDGANWNTVFTGTEPLNGSASSGGTVTYVGAAGTILEGT